MRHAAPHISFYIIKQRPRKVNNPLPFLAEIYRNAQLFCRNLYDSSHVKFNIRPMPCRISFEGRCFAGLAVMPVRLRRPPLFFPCPVHSIPALRTEAQNMPLRRTQCQIRTRRRCRPARGTVPPKVLTQSVRTGKDARQSRASQTVDQQFSVYFLKKRNSAAPVSWS